MAMSIGSSTMMMVTNVPAEDMALANCAYCSPSDHRTFAVPDSDLFLAQLGDAFVLNLSPSETIPSGQIGLNAIQRRHARVSTGDQIPVSKFVLPDDFNLALLTLELEFVKKGTKEEEVDGSIMSQQLRNRFINQREAFSSRIFRQTDFDLQSLGIGGMSAIFADIFRRAFASRLLPPHMTSELGIKHVKGMLLYGPPGNGKTLIAPHIGKMFHGREPKIVNGPEIISRDTERIVRDLFADAEQEQRTRGDQSELHVIIFDEIDAICTSRGSTTDGTGVHENIINLLLEKMDGVESLNNILLIGMTNRKYLLDAALLRPGRFEVQLEISLPDENGRLEILHIHTNTMSLYPDVNLQELAARTRNYTGAELEGVVKSAASYALNRQLSMDDFLNALHEIVPAFGVSMKDLERCGLNVMVNWGRRHEKICKRTMLLAEQVRVSEGSPIVSCLLEGPSGSGKTAMAVTVGILSDFPFVNIISAESMTGLSEASKCAQIVKVFEDAYMSALSVIILDDIERLLDYDPIGPRFSNRISQTLMLLLKQTPPEGRRLLVIGTTSEVTFLDSVGICDAFSLKYHVPTLKRKDAKKVLEQHSFFFSKY